MLSIFTFGGITFYVAWLLEDISKISAKGIRMEVLKNLIMLHNTLYERYEGFDWKDSQIYSDYKNYGWIIVKEVDVMDTEGCSKHHRT